VFLLILESLGSTELLFILVMALVFFGPRKLPQISRSLGKNMAHFRRASEDFKRTWEKEVNIEQLTAMEINGAALPAGENSILGDGQLGEPVQQPTIQAIAPDRVVPRQSLWPDASQDSDTTSPGSAVESGVQSDSVTDETGSSSKRDWL
jgi:Tat protein translocase TatB subunit